jgi:hypothetical protein
VTASALAGLLGHGGGPLSNKASSKIARR